MRRALAAVLLALAPLAAGCGGEEKPAAEETPPIRIGTKNFTEQRILGEIYRQALEEAGYEVSLKLDIGSTEIVHEALRGGAIDMYPEYVGVLLSEVAGIRDRPADPDEALEMARAYERRNGFRVLNASPFSDSNALAVLPERAERLGLRTIADLGGVPGGATIAAPPEFRTRVEGLVGLQEAYGLKGVRMRAVPIGAQYGALEGRQVDAAAVFTTDGQLAEREYVLLRDPAGVFADQHVAPVVSAQIVNREGAKFTDAVDAVTARLTVEAMRRMNAEVDIGGRSPATVARGFLAEG